MNQPSTVPEQLRAEVVGLHRFFVRWFSGQPFSDPASAIANVLARFRDDFVYLYPGGTRSNKADLARMLQQARGTNPDFRIQVEQFDIRPLADGSPTPRYWVVTYKEFQAGARQSAESNGRISSATFEVQGAVLQWVHLHETWLPTSEIEAFDHEQLRHQPTA